MADSPSYRVLYDHDRIRLAQAPGIGQPARLELQADDAVISDFKVARRLAYYLNAYADWHELWTIYERPDDDPEKQRLNALLEPPS